MYSKPVRARRRLVQNPKSNQRRKWLKITRGSLSGMKTQLSLNCFDVNEINSIVLCACVAAPWHWTTSWSASIDRVRRRPTAMATCRRCRRSHACPVIQHCSFWFIYILCDCILCIETLCLCVCVVCVVKRKIVCFSAATTLCTLTCHTRHWARLVATTRFKSTHLRFWLMISNLFFLYCFIFFWFWLLFWFSIFSLSAHQVFYLRRHNLYIYSTSMIL